MMHPKSFPNFVTRLFPILLLFIHISCQIKPAAADEEGMKRCEPRRCGNVTNIRYPFWFPEPEPEPEPEPWRSEVPYCGHPGFAVDCVDDTLILVDFRSLSLVDFTARLFSIQQIFYNNDSFWAMNANFTLAKDDCPIAPADFTFVPVGQYEHFRLSNKIFFYNCSAPPPPKDFMPTCADNIYTYYDPLSPPYYDHPLSRCNLLGPAAVLPAAADEEDNNKSSNYVSLLKGRFLVEWLGVGDCRGCEASGGRCRYNFSTASFFCLCPDGRQDPSSCARKNHDKQIIIGVCVGVGGLIIAGILCFFCYNYRKRKQPSPSSILLSRNASSEPPSVKDPELGNEQYYTQIFVYEELEDATNGFSTSNELGDGGFGTVYKGKLRDGRTVAIKRFKNNYRLVDQFMNEVFILSSLRHQNLVALYGCTSRHSRELLLVYEYVPNGTAADHLHGSRAREEALSWPIRMSIAIETADALSYLHAVTPQIIHRDVKTSNILLDKVFRVKVADFGLSRFFPVNATHVSTAPQGTPGYVDPEYRQCYQLTDKSDVYSFGVVLVELISSKPAVDVSRQRHEINLASMAICMIQNQELDRLVDPKLWSQSNSETRWMIQQVADLAFRCLQAEKEMRPTIKEVLRALRGIEEERCNRAKGVEAAVNDEDCLLEKK